MHGKTKLTNVLATLVGQRSQPIKRKIKYNYLSFLSLLFPYVSQHPPNGLPCNSNSIVSLSSPLLSPVFSAASQ